MFDVKQYGALGNGVADDTVAIQNTINACYLAGGGDVYFPNGIYIVNGNLQTNIGGVNPNSQLYIPPLYPNAGAIPTTFGQRTHIRLVGQTIPNMTSNGVLVDFRYSDEGVIIKSTLAAARISGTTPSILGGKDIGTTFGTFNYNYLTIENLNFIVPHDDRGPLLCGINAQEIASTSFNRVQVMVGRSYVGYPQPTRELVGIITGRYNSDGQSYLFNSSVSGFKYGIVLSEHIALNQVTVGVCEFGLVFYKINHPGLIGRLSTHWCKNQMAIVGSQPFLGWSYPSAGPTYVQINQFDCESRFNGDWYDYDNFIVDVQNEGRGLVKYHILHANDSKVRPDLFRKIGGIHINTEALGFEKGRIFSQKEPGPVISNTTSSFDLFPARNAKEKTAYANSFMAGDEIIFSGKAYVTTAPGSNGLTFAVQVGVTIYSQQITLGNSYSNLVEFQISCKFISVGAGGRLKVLGALVLVNGARIYIASLNDLAVNTTIDNIIAVIAKWTTASPANLIQLVDSAIELK